MIMIFPDMCLHPLMKKGRTAVQINLIDRIAEGDPGSRLC